MTFVPRYRSLKDFEFEVYFFNSPVDSVTKQYLDNLNVLKISNSQILLTVRAGYQIHEVNESITFNKNSSAFCT